MCYDGINQLLSHISNIQYKTISVFENNVYNIKNPETNKINDVDDCKLLYKVNTGINDKEMPKQRSQILCISINTSFFMVYSI